MVNALTGNGLSSLLTTGTNLNTVRIAERMYTDMRKKTDAIEAGYDEDVQPLQARRGTLAGRLRDLQAVQTAVSNGEQQVKDVQLILFEMRTLVNRAEANPDSRSYYVSQFNDRLKEINTIADRYSDTYNIVGNADVKTLLPPEKSVQVSDFTAEETFQALYLGTSFNIIGTGASEGVSYQNEPKSNFMQAVDAPGGDEQDTSILHDSSRVQNVVVSGDTIQFDLDGTTAYTGTVEKGGLGIMPSWYYDNFTDFDGMRQAIRDAESHLNDVSFSLRQIDIEVTPFIARVERDVGKIESALSDAATNKNKEVSEIEEETRRQFEAVEQSLAQSSADLDRYKTILQSLNKGPFADIFT